ncbi:hypothetical protein CBM2606_A110229 [Cupriavidus taiwanensis]|nr:hypothetical protein CBM2606_A110229 [Cupriavidus taiwanensis]
MLPGRPGRWPVCGSSCVAPVSVVIGAVRLFAWPAWRGGLVSGARLPTGHAERNEGFRRSFAVFCIRFGGNMGIPAKGISRRRGRSPRWLNRHAQKKTPAPANRCGRSFHSGNG